MRESNNKTDIIFFLLEIFLIARITNELVLLFTYLLLSVFFSHSLYLSLAISLNYFNFTWNEINR